MPAPSSREEPALRNFTVAGVALAVVLIVGNDEKRSIDHESSENARRAG